MNKLLMGMIMASAMQAASAAPQVWRYVDSASGQTTYSNVPLRGQKGERIEILSHPVSQPARAVRSSAGAAPGAPVPIPAEVLRRLQGERASSGLPASLPPLPALPGAGSPASASIFPAEPAPAPEARPPEPRWAKEVAVDPGIQPAWARDPFTGR